MPDQEGIASAARDRAAILGRESLQGAKIVAEGAGVIGHNDLQRQPCCVFNKHLVAVVKERVPLRIAAADDQIRRGGPSQQTGETLGEFRLRVAGRRHLVGGDSADVVPIKVGRMIS